MVTRGQRHLKGAWYLSPLLDGRPSWNPLQPSFIASLGIWALRVRLQMENRVRELELFNLRIDSKLCGRDLVALKVRDASHGDEVASRATVAQHKTHQPVQFELTGTTREARTD